MKVLVAPTYFMMLISLRRVKTDARMVLVMMTSETIVSATIIAPPKMLIICRSWTSVSVISVGAWTLSTLSSPSIWVFSAAAFSGSRIWQRKEAGMKSSSIPSRRPASPSKYRSTIVCIASSLDTKSISPRPSTCPSWLSIWASCSSDVPTSIKTTSSFCSPTYSTMLSTFNEKSTATPTISRQATSVPTDAMVISRLCQRFLNPLPIR